jgi:hypothetical protein
MEPNATLNPDERTPVEVPWADDLANRAFGINDMLAPPRVALEPLASGSSNIPVDLADDDAETLKQIELIERVMDRKRRPLAPAWQSGRYVSDRLTKGFLLPVIEAAKYNPLLNRVHCIPASSSGKERAATETQGILPIELSSKDMFNFWWSSVLLDLFESRNKAAPSERAVAARYDALIMQWLLMFRVAVQRCTVDRNWESPERAWLTAANAILLGFYRYATSGQPHTLSDLDWKTADAAMLLHHPDSSGGGGSGGKFSSGPSSSLGAYRPPGGGHPHKRSAGGGSGGAAIPWPIDWLERHGYPMPVRAFTCQRCQERGFNASRCPCRDGKTPPGFSNKKSKPTDADDRATGN